MLAWIAAAALSCLQDDAQIRTWVEQLSSVYEEERIQAREQLKKVKEKAEPHLVEALERDDHQVRRICIELLTASKSPKGVPAARRFFLDPDQEQSVRQAAFDYFRAVPKEAELALIDALDSPEEAWQLGAIQSLKESGSAKCAAKMVALYERPQTPTPVKDAAFDCLQNLGEPARPFMMALLKSRDPAARLGALRGLRASGVEAEAILEPVAKLFITEAEADVLSEACDVLREVGAKAEPVFLEGLKSALVMVRMRSLEGLTALKSEAAVPGVGECFETEENDAIRTLARAFLVQNGVKSEAVFLRALDSKNPKIRLASIGSLGEIKSDAAFDRIAELYAKDADPEVHRSCFDYLERVPARAEKQFLAALKDADADLRRRAILALGSIKSEAAIPALIDLLNDLNPQIRQAATDALVASGPSAMRAVNAAVAEKRIRSAQVETLLVLFAQEEVERALDRMISPSGGCGFFEGQFNELKELGKDKVVPVLLKIASDPNYRPRIAGDKGAEWLRHKTLKSLSLMALGELGDEAVAARLKEIVRARKLVFGEAEFELFVVALFRLGDRKPFEEFSQHAMKEVEESLRNGNKHDAANRLFEVAQIQNRVGARADAEKTYLRLLPLAEERAADGIRRSPMPEEVLYNLACLAALGGDKAKAVDMLIRAVDGGFKDRAWIEIDRDLESIRREEKYKALMADARKFETKEED